MRSYTIVPGVTMGLRASFELRGMAKAKKQVFSKVKAVKANARARVGTPPPERVLPDPKQKHATKPRHKETLADLLSPPHPAGDQR
jgi:hypothetical protein